MPVTFYGWKVHYGGADDLKSEQEPQSGKTYIMYHGTTIDAARTIIQSGFRQSTKGMLGLGVYVSRSKKKARHYPLDVNVKDKVVLKLSVNVGKVKKIDKDDHPLQKTWHSAGYDTAWVPPNCGLKAVPSGLEEDCVWDPKRIEVIGIALAPNPTISTELKQLITDKTEAAGGAAASARTCQLCKIKKGSAHLTNACWGCDETICTLMSEHKCSYAQ